MSLIYLRKEEKEKKIKLKKREKINLDGNGKRFIYLLIFDLRVSQEEV